MIKDNIAFLLHPSLRGRAFIQNMLKKNILPSEVLLMKGDLKKTAVPPNLDSKNYFDPYEEPTVTLERANLDFSSVPSLNCNDDLVIKKLESLKSEWVIYSGGGILRKKVLSIGKKFIHIHPGYLPNYRGSTCFYYSIINEGLCMCSGFVMEEKLDSGGIILTKSFTPPPNIDLDYIFDPWMRSETICDILNQFDFSSEIVLKDNDLNQSEMYYIIHPVLKHIALYKSKNI
tara:strand:+ start:18879 stop:19571 length:693 start_codon:yes stop_codon:yes gene_type:complete